MSLIVHVIVRRPTYLGRIPVSAYTHIWVLYLKETKLYHQLKLNRQTFVYLRCGVSARFLLVIWSHLSFTLIQKVFECMI